MYLVSLSDKVLYEVARGVPLAGPDPESAWSGASVVGGVVGGILLGVVAAFAFVAWRRKAKAGEGRGKGRVAAAMRTALAAAGRGARFKKGRSARTSPI